MNLKVNVENNKNNVYGSVDKNDVVAAIRRACEGRFASVTEAALTIKGRIVATREVLADREDVEAVHRVLIGCGWEEEYTAEEQVVREYFLAASEEEKAIIRLLFQVALRDPDLANEMHKQRIKGEQHPEAVAPALNKAIADIHWMLSKRVA